MTNTIAEYVCPEFDEVYRFYLKNPGLLSAELDALSAEENDVPLDERSDPAILGHLYVKANRDDVGFLNEIEKANYVHSWQDYVYMLLEDCQDMVDNYVDLLSGESLGNVTSQFLKDALVYGHESVHWLKTRGRIGVLYTEKDGRIANLKFCSINSVNIRSRMRSYLSDMSAWSAEVDERGRISIEDANFNIMYLESVDGLLRRIGKYTPSLTPVKITYGLMHMQNVTDRPLYECVQTALVESGFESTYEKFAECHPNFDRLNEVEQLIAAAEYVGFD